MKKIYIILLSLLSLACGVSAAEGWPAQYGGVMMQGFYWDSYTDTQWNNLESQADELAAYFNLIWVPNSAYAGSLTNNMGYHPVYWYDHKSAFGTEAALRSMINTFKAKGLGVIEDVVINHRLGVSSWTDFPAETVNGETWKLYPTDICADDEAGANGYSVGVNADTGEGWGGARDLDHTRANVQKNVINYLRYLKEDLGYVGFRYDFVKGFAAKYVGLYNDSVNPAFSVGECWDGVDTIKTWINGTKQNGVIQSAAFDFPMKYNINDAFGSRSWSSLDKDYLAKLTDYKRYSVTFVDNHDTGRPSSEGGAPLYANVEAANAYILMMPGTPCVWLSHWKAHKAPIKRLITARRLAGIHNQSNVTYSQAFDDGYAVSVAGTKGSLLLLVGTTSGVSLSGYKQAVSGDNYVLYITSSIDISDIEAIPDDAQSYDVPDFCTVEEGEVSAFFEAPQTWNSTVKCWAWTSNDNFTGGSWPGATCTMLGTAANGNKVWKWTWNGKKQNNTSATQPTYIIFSNSGSPQTQDMPFINGGYYNLDGHQATVTGIAQTTIEDSGLHDIFDLQGRKVKHQTTSQEASSGSLQRGVYIRNGKKFVVK